MKKVYLILFSVFSILLILYPETVADTVKEALSFSVNNVIPSLFCVMVLSKLMIGSGALTSVYPLMRPLAALLRMTEDESAAFITGNLCGFPSGAYSVYEIFKSRPDTESSLNKTSLAVISNNVSVGFSVSFAGGAILGSKETGFIIYLSQLFASFIIGAFLRRNIKIKKDIHVQYCLKKTSFCETVCRAVSDSSKASVNLAGFIAFFSVISVFMTALLEKYGAPPFLISAVRSILEICGGCRSADPLPFFSKIVIVSFSCGFSGLCVIFQSAPYLYGAKIKIRKYILLKLIQGALTGVFCLAIIKLVHSP